MNLKQRIDEERADSLRVMRAALEILSRVDEDARLKNCPIVQAGFGCACTGQCMIGLRPEADSKVIHDLWLMIERLEKPVWSAASGEARTQREGGDG